MTSSRDGQVWECLPDDAPGEEGTRRDRLTNPESGWRLSAFRWWSGGRLPREVGGVPQVHSPACSSLDARCPSRLSLETTSLG